MAGFKAHFAISHAVSIFHQSAVFIRHSAARIAMGFQKRDLESCQIDELAEKFKYDRLFTYFSEADNALGIFDKFDSQVENVKSIDGKRKFFLIKYCSICKSVNPCRSIQ